MVTLEIGSKKKGYSGMHYDEEAPPMVSGSTSSAIPGDEDGVKTSTREDPNFTNREKLKGLIKKILRVPDAEAFSSGGLGITPGWDSLSQIEIIITVESEFGVSFSSAEISEVTQYSLLEKVVLRKLGGK